MIDSGCSFHIFCEKEKFARLSYCDGGLVTLPNDERVKVEGIGEVVIVTHDGVKRRLGGVRYIPKLERNLISLGRLESKGCTFKASGGSLKVIKGSMVLMRGRRNESNLYVLQVEGGNLGHNVDCKSPKKVTFEDDERFKLEGEIVEPSSKSHFDGGEFDHLVAYSLACTIESDVVSARKYESISFGSINEVIDGDDLGWLDEAKSRGSSRFEEEARPLEHNWLALALMQQGGSSSGGTARRVERQLLGGAASSPRTDQFLF